MNCRINNKRNWTCRILLESFFHLESIFVTLTYNDQCVPIDEDGVPTLDPADLRIWIAKFRKAYSGEHGALRFFACGEYGDKTQRPHYHVILFGASLSAEPMIAETWSRDGKSLGFTQVGEMNATRAAYIASYTTKKMTKQGDSRLGKRHPEFARMSMRNGIGYPAVGWLAKTMSSKEGIAAMAVYGDVWNSVRIDGKIWPLSNYLRRKLRDALGVSQDARERAEQLVPYYGEIKEFIEPEPLPENYGPWKDLAEVRTPSTAKEEKSFYGEEIKKAVKQSEKLTRRTHSTRINSEKI